jgi:hypothetical protein
MSQEENLNPTFEPHAQDMIGQFNRQINGLMKDGLEYARRAQAYRALEAEAEGYGRRGVQGMVESMAPALREAVSLAANQYQILRLGERLERFSPDLKKVLGDFEWDGLQGLLKGRRELIRLSVSEAGLQVNHHFINLAAELERELPDIRRSLQQHAASSITAQMDADRLIKQCDWVGGWMRSQPLSEPRQLPQTLLRDLNHAAQLSDALCAAKLQEASQLYSQASISLLAEGFETRGLRKPGLDGQAMQHFSKFTANRSRQPFQQHTPLAEHFGGDGTLIGKLQSALKGRGVPLEFSPVTKALLQQAGLPVTRSWQGDEQARDSGESHLPNR